MSSLIRTSADLGSFAAPRSFSQLVTSFFGAMYQGILLYALCSLIFLFSDCTFAIRRIYFLHFLDFITRLLPVIRSYVSFRINLSFFYSLFALCLNVLFFFSLSLYSLDNYLLIIFLSLCSCQSTVKSLRRFYADALCANDYLSIDSLYILAFMLF